MKLESDKRVVCDGSCCECPRCLMLYICIVLLRFQTFCCRSLSVGFARKTAVFSSVSVFVCPVFPLSSMWYVYAAYCTSNLQQYVTYFCV